MSRERRYKIDWASALIGAGVVFFVQKLFTKKESKQPQANPGDAVTGICGPYPAYWEYMKSDFFGIPKTEYFNLPEGERLFYKGVELDKDNVDYLIAELYEEHHGEDDDLEFWREEPKNRKYIKQALEQAYKETI